MTPVSPATAVEALQWRYACKKFDPTRTIPADTWAGLEQALVLTPSSFGLQPWKFVVVTDPATKARLTPVSWGQRQVEDASHVVVLAARTAMPPDVVAQYVRSATAQRGLPDGALAGMEKMINGFVATPGFDARDWAAKQAYIALGNFMTTAALLGVDTCPMEGIEPAKYDAVLGLEGTGFATVVACPAGYRADDDKYAVAKKVRFPASEVVLHI